MKREPAPLRLEGIAPFFIVRDVTAGADLYRVRLGFTITRLTPSGAPVFAIVRRDGAELLLKAPDATVGTLPERHPYVRWDAFIPTTAPDALSGRGVAVRATEANASDGLKGFEVRDMDGYVLFFGHPV